MKRFLFSALLAGALIMSGCTTSTIEYQGSVTTAQSGSDTAQTSAESIQTAPLNNDAPVSTYEEAPQEYSEHIQTEGNCDRDTQSGLLGYEGNGYISLSSGQYTTINVNVPTSQHYKISLAVCSVSAKLEIIVGGENEIDSKDGDYKTVDGVSQGALYIDQSTSFKPFSMNGVYLTAGDNKITVNALSGVSYIDYVAVENGSAISDTFYSVSDAPADKGASPKTVRVMNYLAGIYGKNVLTGQYVTANTNAEVNAVYNTTERFPAIRSSDLMQFSSYYPIGREDKNDLDLAIDWANSGGLVSYSWTWYAPDDSKSHYVSSLTSFDFSKAATTMDLSLVSLETVEKLYGEGSIPKECYLLIKDMDAMVPNLKKLADADVTVLFRPLMEAGGAWYWWGESADNYKWLWQTMVTRFNSYHGLHNLIWVWNGENPDFYPGDEYVDIISEDVYNSQMDSAQLRFLGTAYYPAGNKPVALSESAVIPDPDALYRDNAKWLWFSVWRGDYIINSDGSYSEAYTSIEDAKYAYNSAFYITRDELPDFNTLSTE